MYVGKGMAGFLASVATALASVGLGTITLGTDEEAVKTDAALVVAAAHLAEQIVPDPAPTPAKDETPVPESIGTTPREKTPLETRVALGRVLIFRTDNCVLCDRIQKEVADRLIPQGWFAGTTDDVDFQTVDSPQRQDLVRRYGVTKVPTVILVRGDVEVDRAVGYVDATRLADWLNQARQK